MTQASSRCIHFSRIAFAICPRVHRSVNDKTGVENGCEKVLFTAGNEPLIAPERAARVRKTNHENVHRTEATPTEMSSCSICTQSWVCDGGKPAINCLKEFLKVGAFLGDTVGEPARQIFSDYHCTGWERSGVEEVLAQNTRYTSLRHCFGYILGPPVMKCLTLRL